MNDLEKLQETVDKYVSLVEKMMIFQMAQSASISSLRRDVDELARMLVRLEEELR